VFPAYLFASFVAFCADSLCVARSAKRAWIGFPISERTMSSKGRTARNAVASEMRPYPALRARDKWHAMELRIVTNRGKKTCAPGNRTNYTEELMFALR
jgi:hypothetical protein